MANGYSINWKKLEVNQDGVGTPVHPLVALMFSAMVGGLFVVFLPFIGLYMFAGFMLKKAGVEISSLFRSNIAPQPVGASFATGHEPKSEPGKNLEDLRAEIEEKRK